MEESTLARQLDDRDARLAHKVELARALLARLSPEDPRVHLLEIAIERSDETLLDGLVRELRARTHRTIPPLMGTLAPSYSKSE